MPGISAAEEKITFLCIEWDNSYRAYLHIFFYKFIDACSILDRRFHFRGRVMNDLFKLLHQLIVLDQLLIQPLQLFHLDTCQLFWEMLLQVFFILTEGNEVIVMEYQVRE